MSAKLPWFALTVVVFSLVVAGCGTPTPAETPPAAPPPEQPPVAPPAGSVSRGGLLYDRWWRVAELDEPTGDMPIWARQTTNTRSGTDTWRCKECHGWDYMGADGAYGSGSHFTGFPGVFEAQDKTSDQLVAQLTGEVDSDHDFSVMSDDDIADLVAFLREGLVDMSAFIDADKAAIGGDLANGEELFAASCAACHGEDGRAINFHDPAEPEYVGNIAVDNPWEFIHKVRAGQPGTAMPSAIDAGWSMQDVIDVLAYSQTLPTEPAVAGSVSRGGLLYDRWWRVAELDEPTGDMPIWARQTTNTRSGTDTWRCKECHGWDYMGADGAYGSGSHFTGFPGVFEAQDKTSDQLVAQLTGEVDSDHDFSVMSDDDIADLVAFLREGLVDMSAFIDADKAAIGGDLANGEELFAASCAACHGEDGRAINFHDPAEPEYVGNIAVDNPWEFIHKVRAGQPGTAMPSAIDAGWSMQDVIDVLAYSQTLPTE